MIEAEKLDRLRAVVPGAKAEVMLYGFLGVGFGGVVMMPQCVMHLRWKAIDTTSPEDPWLTFDGAQGTSHGFLWSQIEALTVDTSYGREAPAESV